MSRIAYVNGAYLPLSRAGVSVEDRGFQFADAIYEVWGVRAGRLLDVEGHFARLARSLWELRIAPPMTRASLRAVLHETIRRNRVRDGIVYLQISRGAAARDHAFPAPAVAPSVIVTAKSLDQRKIAARMETGVAVITAPDIRWGRCDIKTVGLLPNVLARQNALEAGAYDCWFVDGRGFVTEGSASNAWIVDKSGALRTAPLSANILHGVTRAAFIALAQSRQMRVIEESFTLADVREAREAFLTSASNAALPVVSLDGAPIGDGRPGPVAARLRAAYERAA